MTKAGEKIMRGMLEANDYVSVERAVHDWVRDDAPLAAKMNLTPEHITKLVDRITGARTRSWGTPTQVVMERD